MSQHAPCVQITLDEGAYDSEVDRVFEKIAEHRSVSDVVRTDRGRYAVCPVEGAPESALDDIEAHVGAFPIIQSATIVHAC